MNSLWDSNSLVHFYDANTSIVEQSAAQLSKMGDKEVDVALNYIREKVRILSLAVPDNIIEGIAISVNNDLYKILACAGTWSQEKTWYIQSVFGVFNQVLRERGKVIRYLVDNCYPEHLERPLDFYKEIIPCADLVYVCPHEVAFQLAKHDGFFSDGRVPMLDELSRWIDEARMVARRIIGKAIESSRNLLYLDIDYCEYDLNYVIDSSKKTGAIIVFRNESPATSSKVRVIEF